jgi:hypothetical protein
LQYPLLVMLFLLLLWSSFFCEKKAVEYIECQTRRILVFKINCKCYFSSLIFPFYCGLTGTSAFFYGTIPVKHCLSIWKGLALALRSGCEVIL